MRLPQIREAVKDARDRVSRQIQGEVNDALARGSRYAVVISEGYNGGYRDALDDIMLVINGVKPQRNNWWECMK